MEGKIENLKKKLDDAEKVLSNDDDDLRAMFYNLKDGLQNINENIKVIFLECMLRINMI
jgi:hypothetical protein